MKYILIILIFISNNVFSQNVLIGKVFDKDKNIIDGATIYLSKIENNDYISHTTSDENGSFTIYSKKNNVKFTINAMGYKTIEKVIIYDPSIDTLHFSFEMEIEAKLLNEVVIKSEKNIKEKKDTIRYNLNHFLIGNEVVIEDALKKLPGITVESNGTIKYGNQEIEKVMVDGEDFFEKGYKTLTKNMPINPVVSVDLLTNYSNNKLFKGIENSNKVAINLNLKESVKRTWFGDIEAGVSLNKLDSYNSNLNLMNFGKKTKYYILTNLNTIGKDLTKYVDDYSKNLQTYNMGFLNKDLLLSENYIISTKLNNPPIDDTKFNLNNSKLYSVNMIFNPNTKLKINTTFLSIYDIENMGQNNDETFNFLNLNFLNQSRYIQNISKNIHFTKTNVLYELTKNKSIEYTNKNIYNSSNTLSDFIINESEYNGMQKDKVGYTDNKLSYTFRINENKLIQLTTKYLVNILNQDFSTLYTQPSLISNINSTNNNSRQTLNNNFSILGFELYGLNKYKNGNSIELLLSNQLNQGNLLSNYFNDSSFRNIAINIHLFENKNAGILRYTYINKKLKIVPGFNLINISQYYENQISNKKSEILSTRLLPNIFISYNLNNHNILSFKHENIINTLPIKSIFPSYINTNFRQGNFGADSLNYLSNKTYTFNFQHGNFTDILFVNSFFNYSYYNTFLSDEILQSQNSLYSKKIFANDKSAYTFYFSIDRFFKSLHSNINFNYINYTTFSTNTINNQVLKNFKIESNRYIVKVRSVFKGIFNYSISTNFDFIKSNTLQSYNSNLNNQSNIDLNFNFNNQNLQINLEKYYINIYSKHNQQFSFLDLRYDYSFKNTKYKFSFFLNNILNTSHYFTNVPTQTGFVMSDYKLRGRNFLISVQMRL